MTRILFVDDEQKLLEGLQRMLRPLRNEWQMHFCPSGADGLAKLETTPIDVVVSDMRMPGMDGAAFLTHVSEKYPSVIRIVLSGQFDVEAGLRLVQVAHQLLAKPCNPAELKAAIQRLSAEKIPPLSEVTKRIVGSIGTLPSPPRVCSLLMQAIQNQDTSIETISSIVGRDTALSAKILQLVNSAFFGLPHRVHDIPTAIADLGINLLRQLVLTAEIAKSFRPVTPTPGFSVDDHARHSNLAAAIGSAICETKAQKQAATMSGLLHDTGMLVAATRIPADFAKAIECAGRTKRPLHVCEAETFGCTHAEIGAHLLDLWGLPECIVEAVATHHNPQAHARKGADLPLPLAIHIADALAHEVEGDLTELAGAEPGRPPEGVSEAVAGAFAPADFAAWRTAALRAAAAMNGRQS